MQTLVQTPMEVFGIPQRLVVPLFQRAYVWNKDDQWQPLWEDFRRQAEMRLDTATAPAPHFLGAVVLQQQLRGVGLLPQHQIIDGQQRLTTLQIALDAAHGVFTAAGEDRAARQLLALTENPNDFRSQDDDRFKVWPTHRDRPAYHEVMATPQPIDYEGLKHHGSRLVHGHAYFAEVIGSWVEEAGADAVVERCQALATALMTGLHLVTINLDANEDSQAIFETLNARGTPLTAADLIKNFVFQRLAADGVPAEPVYRDHWKLFESKFWEKNISVGRYLISRSSLFFNQWLIAQTGSEIGPRATFSRFKQYVEHDSTVPIADLLPLLHQQAVTYQEWIEHAAQPEGDLAVVPLAVYRTQAVGLELLKPVLIWLHDPQRPVPPEQVDVVVRAVESWLMRRALLRLSMGSLGRVVADLINAHRRTDPAILGERVTAYLTRLDRMSTYWPGDAEIRETLQELAAYRRYPRGRLRMFLEAAEDHLRRYAHGKESFADSRVRRGQLHIEHVLPQQWKVNWKVSDLARQIDREAHVHRLGNLTLLTRPLNSSVSNSRWTTKRSQLNKHDVILLNREIRDLGDDGWDEACIDTRTYRLVDALLATWPVPSGHTGAVHDSRDAQPTWVEFRDLVAVGILAPGVVLTPGSGQYAKARAVVQKDGSLKVGGLSFDTPSAAGAHARKGKATNGWTFWRLDDGRRLGELREEYRRRFGEE